MADTDNMNTSDSTRISKQQKLYHNPSDREALKGTNIKTKTVHTLTLANPSYTYIHLCLIYHNQSPPEPRSQAPPTNHSKAASQINLPPPPPGQPPSSSSSILHAQVAQQEQKQQPSSIGEAPSISTTAQKEDPYSNSTTTSSTINTTDPDPDPDPNATTIDNLTVLKYLHSALRQYLGLHGVAIPLDLLKVEEEEEEEEKQGRRERNIEVWIRVPREDGSKVLAAVGGWVGRGETLERRRGGVGVGGIIGDSGDGAAAGAIGTGKMTESTTTTVSWRVKSWGNWLAEIAGGDGADLFR